MGEVQGTLFRLELDRSVRVEARAERLTADAGAVPLREFMDQSGLTVLLDERLVDGRDPAFHLAVSCRRGQRPLREGETGEPDGLCSQPTLSRLASALGSRKPCGAGRRIRRPVAAPRIRCEDHQTR